MNKLEVCHMRIRSTAGLMAMIAILVSTTYSRQEVLGPPGGGMWGEGQQLRQKLNLTDDQRKEIEKMRLEMAKQSVAHQAKVKTARLELAELFKADSPDRAAIEKKVSEIAQMESQGRLLFINHWFSVNKLLNPDQQKIWKQMLGRAWMQHHMNRMRDAGPGMMPRDRMRRMPMDRPMGLPR
jgi:Spy/CpxP family protein refolding chaperone